jgi:hypothetical protein
MVPQLLDAFVLSPHIEVVETVLPHVSRPSHGHRAGWFLPRAMPRTRRANPSLRACMRVEGVPALWLADQQMKMLGHHDIAQNHESVALSDLF